MALFYQILFRNRKGGDKGWDKMNVSETKELNNKLIPDVSKLKLLRVSKKD